MVEGFTVRVEADEPHRSSSATPNAMRNSGFATSNAVNLFRTVNEMNPELWSQIWNLEIEKEVVRENIRRRRALNAKVKKIQIEIETLTL